MQRLEAADLGRVVRFLGQAAELETDDPFPPELLATFRRLVPCDAVCFAELDRVQQECLAVTGFPDDDDDDDVSPDGYWRLRHEHPVCHYQDLTLDFRAFMISDFVTKRELQRRRIYAEEFRPGGLEYQLLVGLDAPLWHTKVFTFNRSGGRDFGERDRAVLDVLRPHLAQLYRAAEARRRLRAALALHERKQGTVVLLGHGDRIAFASTAARDLLDRYFGKTGVRLPDELQSLLRQPRHAAAHELLRVDAGDRSLVVHFVDDALLLEERQCIARLTPREREILELVSKGNTNAEIAEALWLSPGTVRRHLENVFAKLGVHTRTAAAALLRDGNCLSETPEPRQQRR
jgi:DNA-binding CsgD family transcriptional regulator